MPGLFLVAAFLAGALTAGQNRHLSLALKLPLKDRPARIIRAIVAVFGAGLGFALTWSSLGFVLSGIREGIGRRALSSPARRIRHGPRLSSDRHTLRHGTRERPKERFLALLCAGVLGTVLSYSSVVKVFGALLGSAPAFLVAAQKPLEAFLAKAAGPLIVGLIVSTFFNMPLFVVLGGCAYLTFARQSLPLEVVPGKAYAMLTGFSIAAIPLFTLTGFLLSESRAGERLVRLFKSLFGWIPGGMAVMADLVCAFFTTFTGAAGVTIVALGGLLFFILTGAGYGRRFTVGLLTASGGIGLLFPPSLPVIIYGVASRISIKEMFKGGLLPGT